MVAVCVAVTTQTMADIGYTFSKSPHPIQLRRHRTLMTTSKPKCRLPDICGTLLRALKSFALLRESWVGMVGAL
jgi:hypothetical protein